MPQVKVILTPKYDHPKPLTEGELYCSNCMHHVDYCQCLQMIDVDLPERLHKLILENKATLSVEFKVL